MSYAQSTGTVISGRSENWKVVKIIMSMKYESCKIVNCNVPNVVKVGLPGCKMANGKWQSCNVVKRPNRNMAKDRTAMEQRAKLNVWKGKKLQCGNDKTTMWNKDENRQRGKRQSCSVANINAKKAKSSNVENDKAAMWQRAKLQCGKGQSCSVAKGKAAVWQKAKLQCGKRQR